MSTRSYQPGDAYLYVFTIKKADGTLANSDTPPAGAILRNGVVDATVTVTITNVQAGVYSATCTVPLTYSYGDAFDLLVTALVGGIATGEVVDHVRLSGYASQALTFTTVGSASYLNVNTAAVSGQPAIAYDGTLAASSGTSFTLSASDPLAANTLTPGWQIEIGGTGSAAGQIGEIATYNPATRVGTVASWPLGTPAVNAPYNLIAPAVLAVAPPTTSQIAAALLANPSVPLSNDAGGNVSAMLASGALDAAHVDATVTLRQAVAWTVAALVGQTSGAVLTGPGQVTIYAPNTGSTQARILTTFDSNHNRTSVSLVNPS